MMNKSGFRYIVCVVNSIVNLKEVDNQLYIVGEKKYIWKLT